MPHNTACPSIARRHRWAQESGSSGHKRSATDRKSRQERPNLPPSRRAPSPRPDGPASESILLELLATSPNDRSRTPCRFAIAPRGTCVESRQTRKNSRKTTTHIRLISYERVSTEDQATDSQRDEFFAAGCAQVLGARMARRPPSAGTDAAPARYPPGRNPCCGTAVRACPLSLPIIWQ